MSEKREPIEELGFEPDDPPSDFPVEPPMADLSRLLPHEQEAVERADAATEGLWLVVEDDEWDVVRLGSITPRTGGLPEAYRFESNHDVPQAQADAAFIAHARSDVPMLAAALQEAREQLAAEQEKRTTIAYDALLARCDELERERDAWRDDYERRTRHYEDKVDEMRTAEAALAEARAREKKLRHIVDKQAEDEGLWFLVTLPPVGTAEDTTSDAAYSEYVAWKMSGGDSAEGTAEEDGEEK